MVDKEQLLYRLVRRSGQQSVHPLPSNQNKVKKWTTVLQQLHQHQYNAGSKCVLALGMFEACYN